MDLVLGTAQLGMDYGVNNGEGKLSHRKAFAILDKAFYGGIKLLDTALSYGESENIIGEYMSYSNNRFQIATKLPSSNYRRDDETEISLNKSLKNLGVEVIDYYFFHSFSEFRDNAAVLRKVEENKKKGRVVNIGVSLYDEEELDFILNEKDKSVDAVQIPFNIFDLRWKKNSLLKRAKEKDIKIFARSIYLQGLFFLEQGEAGKIHPKAHYYIEELIKFAHANDMETEEVAMHYVKMHPEIDYILVGCETPEQVSKNITMFEDKNTNKYGLIDEFALENFGDIEKEIVDPRVWGL